VLAFVIGRLSAPDNEAHSNPPATAIADPGAELQTDYPHSKDGAIVAAAAYQRALANPAIIRPGGIKKRIGAIATTDYADEMLEANQPGADRLMAEPISEGVQRGIPTVYAGVPIAYRVLSYTADRARIQNWGFPLSAMSRRLSRSPTSAPARSNSCGRTADGRSPPRRLPSVRPPRRERQKRVSKALTCKT